MCDCHLKLSNLEERLGLISTDDRRGTQPRALNNFWATILESIWNVPALILLFTSSTLAWLMGWLELAARSRAWAEMETSTAEVLGPPEALGAAGPACSAGLAAPTLDTPPR